MGVFHGRDVFSPRYITAEITDSSNEIHFVPIKYEFGDYFITEIKKQLYCFKISDRIKTYKQKLGRAFQVMHYDTDNYNAIDGGKVSLLEETLRKNNLPKVNNMLAGILARVAKKEKYQTKVGDFEGMNLQEIIDEIADQKEKYPDHVENITTFINELPEKQIVTPVKKVSEFLTDDVFTPDPKFLGDVITAYQRTDFEQKKMANMPKTNKANLLKIILVVGIVLMLAIAGIWFVNSGALSGITSPFGSFNVGGGATQHQGPLTTNDITSKYPTPEAAKAAIDRGEVKLSDFPKQFQDFIKNTKTPTAVATP